MCDIDLTGLTEKFTKKGTKYYENNLGDLLAKECTRCREVKSFLMFYKDKSKLFGLSIRCKSCDDTKSKRHHKNDPHYRENNRISRRRYYNSNKEKWLTEEYRERQRVSCKVYYRANKEKFKVYSHIRRARKRSLPDTFTAEQQTELLAKFNEGCALTGETNDIHLDHVLPLASGQGGTYQGNMIPLRADLNCSKGDRNIFEWFEANRQRFELSQERFDAMVEYLAELNEMSAEEYRKWYDDCYYGNSNESDVI